MPRIDYKNCRNCGRHSEECGELSHTRLCSVCSKELFETATDEQVNHHGPTFQLWRRRIAASVGGVILDDVRAHP